MENQKRGVLTLTNVQRFGVGAAVGAALITNANAAVDVAGPVSTLTTDGTAAITAVGAALLGLAGVAVVFKWVKAAFFS
ncbi:major capsid protein [Acinetobacter baumannii]